MAVFSFTFLFPLLYLPDATLFPILQIIEANSATSAPTVLAELCRLLQVYKRQGRGLCALQAGVFSLPVWLGFYVLWAISAPYGAWSRQVEKLHICK